jgi:hypothetical protein
LNNSENNHIAAENQENFENIKNQEDTANNEEENQENNKENNDFEQNQPPSISIEIPRRSTRLNKDQRL